MNFTAGYWAWIIIAFLVCQFMGTLAFHYLEDESSFYEYLPQRKIFRFLLLEFLAFGGWTLIPLTYFLLIILGIIALIIEHVFIKSYKLIFDREIEEYYISGS